MHTIVLVNIFQFVNYTRFLQLLVVAAFPIFFGCNSQKTYINITGPAMGSTYTIRLVPQRGIRVEPQQIKTNIDSLLDVLNQQMSTYVMNSEISLFNRMPVNSAILISEDFRTVVQRSIHWSNLTDGAFDISAMPIVTTWKTGKADREDLNVWMPPTDLEVTIAKSKIGYQKIKFVSKSLIKTYKDQQLDVNAIAKGWGVDKLFFYIQSLGYNNFMVEIGGEVRISGKNNRGRSWQIGIDLPEPNLQPGEKIYAVIPIQDKAMATSGNYRDFYVYNSKKYSHIINPITAMAVESNIASVTVLAENCMDADALATALNIMSLDEGLELVESLKDVEALWIINKENGFESVLSSKMKIVRDL